VFKREQAKLSKEHHRVTASPSLNFQYLITFMSGGGVFALQISYANKSTTCISFSIFIKSVNEKVVKEILRGFYDFSVLSWKSVKNSSGFANVQFLIILIIQIFCGFVQIVRHIILF
jgi:hypothetical protein